jgi:hypothetical protein
MYYYAHIVQFAECCEVRKSENIVVIDYTVQIE